MISILKTICAIYLLFIPFGIYGQNVSAPGRNVSKETDDFKLAKVYIQRLDSLTKSGELERALAFSVEVLEHCESIGYLEGITDILFTRGIIHRRRGDYAKALHHFYVSLENCQAIGNTKGEADSQNQIGTIYRLQGNYPGALEYYLSSLKNYNSISDTSGMARALNNIGIVYFFRNDYPKALEYYNQSLHFEQMLNNEFGASVSYINIGEVYQKLLDYEKALHYYLKALILAKKYEERDSERDGIGVLYNEIGSIYMNLGDYSLSSNYLGKALLIFEEIGSRQRIAECKLYMGELSFKLGKVQDSKLHLTTALKHAQEIGAVDLISKVNKLLSTVYEALNDPSRAFLHFKMHISARDSLFNDDNTKRVVQAEMLYEFERQIQESKLEQAKKDAIAQEVAHRQRMFRNFLVSILLLLLVVVGMIYNAYKSKQRANIKLFKQQQQIIEKNEELLQQQDEILAQRDEIEKQNKVLEQSQLIIESKNERIISSIEYAQTIQQAILPDVEQLKRFFPEHIIVYLPKDIVSGDFYWFSAVGQKLFAAVVDCTGHGVPGAFMSLIGNTMLNQIVNEWQTYDPALVLELMHQQVRKALNQDSSTSKAHASMDVCFVSIDLKDKKAVFSGASRPLYIVQDGNLEKISGDPRSVGGFQREVKRYFTNHSIDLSKPTFLYLTTDGYVDQMNLSNRKFSPRRLLRLLIDIHKKPTEIQKDLLISEFEIYREGQEQIDDICILGLKI